MATLTRCDFCGEELAGPVAARLVITTGGTPVTGTARSVFALLLEDAPRPQTLDMCGACLDHLLPIRERLRQHAAAQAPPPACAAVAELRHVATLQEPGGRQT